MRASEPLDGCFHSLCSHCENWFVFKSPNHTISNIYGRLHKYISGHIRTCLKEPPRQKIISAPWFPCFDIPQKFVCLRLFYKFACRVVCQVGYIFIRNMPKRKMSWVFRGHPLLPVLLISPPQAYQPQSQRWPSQTHAVPWTSKKGSRIGIWINKEHCSAGSLLLQLASDDSMIVADLSSQLDVEGVMSCCSGSGEDKFQKDHSARSQSTRMFQCLQ